MLIDREKALPSPPPFESDNYHLHGGDDSINEHSPAVPMHDIAITANTTTPQKRILSGITERSMEDSSIETSKSPPSASSSDKNAFRSSMATLNRLDTMEAEENGSRDVSLSADGAEAEWATASEAEMPGYRYYSERGAGGEVSPVSPIKSARENYHQPTSTRRRGWGVGRA